MNRVVLDASAVLTLLNEEPGAEKITLELLSHATFSTVKTWLKFRQGLCEKAETRTRPGPFSRMPFLT